MAVRTNAEARFNAPPLVVKNTAQPELNCQKRSFCAVLGNVPGYLEFKADSHTETVFLRVGMHKLYNQWMKF